MIRFLQPDWLWLLALLPLALLWRGRLGAVAAVEECGVTWLLEGFDPGDPAADHHGRGGQVGLVTRVKARFCGFSHGPILQLERTGF